mmetsp:Transcript_5052/g.12594  ORF Transcript_5052/g.12594 Transcript_5052/m.12594 type:complete len:132 (-) Transcript_5052:3704-4099(-)
MQSDYHCERLHTAWKQLPAVLLESNATLAKYTKSQHKQNSRLFQKKTDNDYFEYRWAPCPGGDTPSAKRMFGAIQVGCIPVILSADFVWRALMQENWNNTATMSNDTRSNMTTHIPTLPHHSEFSITPISG